MHTIVHVVPSLVYLIHQPSSVIYLWLGDFNRHHLFWEEERNNHLLTLTMLTPS